MNELKIKTKDKIKINNKNTIVKQKYDSINIWNTCKINDLTYLFLNKNVTMWDTSNVISI